MSKPATSCHLRYPIPGSITDECSKWCLENSVRVKSSTSTSYFCVVGWGPGGYSGMQQVSPNKKIAIFSMWNDGHFSVSEVKKGPGVKVETFGGEGTGLKSMMPLDWSLDSVVTFKVIGEQKSGTWHCSCYIQDGSKTYFMATFARAGNRPFNSSGFYSFVEDWDRSRNAVGHTICREAEFMNTQGCFDGKEIPIKDATFTKVEDGLDKFAAQKAKGGTRQGVFFLQTGGVDSCGPICESGTRLCLQ